MTLRRSVREEGAAGLAGREGRGGGGGLGCAGGGTLALVTVGGMVLLFAGLARQCAAGGEVILAYASSIRAGAAVSESIGGAEADALTEVLRHTVSVDVQNFIGQAGTACYWVRLEGERGTDARFVLAERGEGMHVIAATLRRDCDCPIDEELPCHLE